MIYLNSDRTEFINNDAFNAGRMGLLIRFKER